MNCVCSLMESSCSAGMLRTMWGTCSSWRSSMSRDTNDQSITSLNGIIYLNKSVCVCVCACVCAYVHTCVGVFMFEYATSNTQYVHSVHTKLTFEYWLYKSLSLRSHWHPSKRSRHCHVMHFTTLTQCSVATLLFWSLRAMEIYLSATPTTRCIWLKPINNQSQTTQCFPVILKHELDKHNLQTRLQGVCGHMYIKLTCTFRLHWLNHSDKLTTTCAWR